MALNSKIDSNITGLRYAKEASIKTLPAAASQVWYGVEPNSYDAFGAEISTVARVPIAADRQRKKGAVVDLDASGSFNTDITQAGIQGLVEGFLFANVKDKARLVKTTLASISAIDPSNVAYDAIESDSTGDFIVGHILNLDGFSESGNNGVFVLTAKSATELRVANNSLQAETSVPVGASITTVGFRFASAGISIVAPSGALPSLRNSAVDLTTLDIVPGEFIYIGGDTDATKFGTVGNNGWARVSRVTANDIFLDKTQDTMVADAGTAKTIEIYWGRTLKNEAVETNQIRHLFQFQRSLGASDTTQKSQIQSDYLVGAVANEMTIRFDEAEKVTVDLGFVAADYETRSGMTGLKSKATSVKEQNFDTGDAYNTTSDFKFLRLSKVDSTKSNLDKLFDFFNNFTIVITNNITANKGIGVLGAFDLTAGSFDVSGDMEAYFSDVVATESIRNYDSLTFGFVLAKGNKGLAVDLPYIAIGDGRLGIEKDDAIKIPLTNSAFADPTFDHTVLMSFFDYLPNAAS